MPHKNASSQNGFVLKNNKHMVTWHLNMAIWIAVDARLPDGPINHVYCYEIVITKVPINALHYIQSIVTQTWVK